MEEYEDEISMEDTRGNYLDEDFEHNDQESDEDCEENFGQGDINIQKLFSLLDDKNQAIEELKRKLANQQVQLAYYLRKNFENSSVLKFSNECLPDLADENMQLSLAMYKFVRDTGRKSRLCILKDRLEEYDQRVQQILFYQEQLIEKRMADDKEWMKDYGEHMGFDEESDQDGNVEYEIDDDIEEKSNLKFKDRAIHVAHLDLCSHLMTNILKVRKELKQFRLCAEKIVDLEAERNALVEQVYSLSAEERFNAAYTNMSKEQVNIEPVVKQSVPNSNPDHPTTSESKTTDSNNCQMKNELSVCKIYTPEKKPSDELKKVLSSIQMEAIKVMVLSKKQRKKYSSELQSIRKENKILKKRLRSMEELTTGETMQELQDKCLRIGQDIHELHRCLESDGLEKDREIQRMIEERRVKNLEEIKLKEEVTQLRAAIEVLRADRNSLQRRLETNEKMADNMKVCERKNKEIMEMNDIIIMQDKQIKDLLAILSKINNEKLQRHENTFVKVNNNNNNKQKRMSCLYDETNRTIRNRNSKIDIKIKNSRIPRARTSKTKCSKMFARNNLNKNYENYNSLTENQNLGENSSVFNITSSENLTLQKNICNLCYNTQSNIKINNDDNIERCESDIDNTQQNNHKNQVRTQGLELHKVNDPDTDTGRQDDISKSTDYLNISCENTTDEICSEQFGTETNVAYTDEAVLITVTASHGNVNTNANQMGEISSYTETEYLKNENFPTSSDLTNNIIPVNTSSEAFFSPDTSEADINEQLTYVLPPRSELSEPNVAKDNMTELSNKYETRNDKLRREDTFRTCRICPSYEQSTDKRCKHATSQLNNMATTSLRVEACDENGKSESMQAVLECTSPHEGFLEMENSSKLRLRLECASPSRSSQINKFHATNHVEPCLSCTQRNIVGDFARTSTFTKEARMQLSNHLAKMKSDLEKRQTTPQYNAASETYSECSN